MPRSVSDDTVTQSPRSMLVSDGTTDIGQTSPRSTSPAPSVALSKGCDNDSDVQTPRSVSDSDGTSPLEESECPQDQDEYYAFLRELAGSFEASSEDDGSEVSSEDGTEDEEEDPPIGRKRSSAWSPESGSPDEDDGSPASPHLPVHTKAQQGEAQNKDSAKGFNSRASGNMQPIEGLQDLRFTPAPRGQVQGPMLGTMTVAACWQQSRGEATGGWRRPAVGWSAGQPPVLCSPATPSMAPSGGTMPGAVSAQRGPDRDRPSMKPMVTPRHDHRRPVVDDYDVVQATEEYAKQRPGTRAEQRRQDLQAAIQLRTQQAKKLLGVAQRECSDPEIRSHYARVRTDILAEVRALESELLSLDEAAVETTTAVQEHLFGRCGSSTETLAAPLEGSRPRSVAVQ